MTINHYPSTIIAALPKQLGQAIRQWGKNLLAEFQTHEPQQDEAQQDEIHTIGKKVPETVVVRWCLVSEAMDIDEGRDEETTMVKMIVNVG